jgi:hypothetical protein
MSEAKHTPLTVYDANDSDGLPRRPLWCIANEAYHNPPDGDDDCIGVHATLDQGFKEDADRLALAWNCHAELVAALERCADVLDDPERAAGTEGEEVAGEAREILARAKVQP